METMATGVGIFRKRPVTIEAIRYNGNNQAQIADFMGASPTFGDNGVGIKTLEGTMFANIGDWIIRGIKGEFYPCKPDVFEATYEAV